MEITSRTTDAEIKAAAQGLSYSTGLPVFLFYKLLTLERMVAQLTARCIGLEQAIDNEPEYPRE